MAKSKNKVKTFSEATWNKYRLMVDDWFLEKRDGAKVYKKWHPKVSQEVAESSFSRIKALPEIKAYIAKVEAEIAERNKVSIDKCVAALDAMAFFDISDLINDDGTLRNLKDIPENARLVIESLETDEIRVEGSTIGVNKKIKLSNRRANIIELMKHLGGYEKDNRQKTDLTLSTPQERQSRIDELLEKAKKQSK